MKVAFISDIHGNTTALEAVLADIRRKEIDKVVVLGDICYRGPEPKRSLEIVKSLNVPMIKGNADEWVVRGIREGEVPEKALASMRTELTWTLSKLEEADLTYLQNLPENLHLEFDGVRVHAFHATPNSMFDIVLPDASSETLKEQMMSDEGSDVFLYGHIHLPYVRYIDGKCIANLGSVGLPFDSLPKASYLVLHAENGHYSVNIERVDYEIADVVNQLRDGNYPQAELLEGVLTYARKPG